MFHLYLESRSLAKIPELSALTSGICKSGRAHPEDTVIPHSQTEDTVIPHSQTEDTVIPHKQ
jgi:hypothetical protein